MSQESDAALIEGIWQMIRAEFAGAPAPELVVEKTELEFRAGIYMVRFDREESDRGRYELGSTGCTHTITLRGEKGTNAGRTIPALYQLKGDRMRVCYGLGGEMPCAFSTLRSQTYVATYRRRDNT